VSNIQEVTDKDFESAVLKADKPVLVDFWATWCGPCRMIAPIVEQIHGELGDKIKVMKMDIDENPSVPMQLGTRTTADAAFNAMYSPRISVTPVIRQ
jgi:thioredoxin 1